MYRSPDQNCVLKLYHLCLPSLCTAPVCFELTVHMSVLLCVHRKREAIRAVRLPVTGQGSTPPLSLIVLPILSVLLHALFVQHVPAS